MHLIFGINSLAGLCAKAGEASIVLQLFIEFLELKERTLVMRTGALRQDLHAEVGISHLLFIIFFTLFVIVLKV